MTRDEIVTRYSDVYLVEHPFVQHKLTSLRDKNTSTREFRMLVEELGTLIGYEATRDLETIDIAVETPLETAMSPVLKGKKLCIVTIMRAGNGLAEGVLKLSPSARVGHVGMYRDPETKKPVEYYLKMPHSVEERTIIVVDPMLATGNSAIAAIDKMKGMGAKDIRFICLFAAPEGIEAFKEAHSDVPIYVGSIDRELDEKAYIRPGVGDAGDRIYGTR
ncbi:uracil phosphoribosyltransferase [Marinomonas mediterranea]|uniref:Uracil phosphoribosyltransferase n=1 Tax=Marinomonas mediterranea (strain ATCC 700492 / JCM 21426 / NBRC 103028 / MMB-1) TaxID=717774 RepID=F2K466_MARM1|nr:uracil phosphoribosyltransferase [Marinomonas mediterranea]ADZ92507.1 uracil phosphoribosyltransferase [Marinomonas mediterranea MMB-1]WCN10453.1 uracil phosphoribosyltransferase [Marinomonas mediterranea]WCN14501.1 uracil phosphoribosyltransferase [Marinomonas mediterranea]WCN18552.1 uracil phosphoribosyltransferase [Marinomonas mediterranea MMB-1]